MSVVDALGHPRAILRRGPPAEARGTVAAASATFGYVHESAERAISLVEFLDDRLREGWVILLVEQKQGVSYIVGELQQAAFLGGCKVWNVAEAMEKTPLRAEVSEPSDPEFRSELIVALRENQQSALLIALPKPTLQQGIEPLADLFRGDLDRILSVTAGRLLNNGAKQSDGSVGLCKDIAEVTQNRLPSLLGL